MKILRWHIEVNGASALASIHCILWVEGWFLNKSIWALRVTTVWLLHYLGTSSCIILRKLNDVLLVGHDGFFQVWSSISIKCILAVISWSTSTSTSSIHEIGSISINKVGKALKHTISMTSLTNHGVGFNLIHKRSEYISTHDITSHFGLIESSLKTVSINR